jgi:hypothetical protein
MTAPPQPPTSSGSRWPSGTPSGRPARTAPQSFRLPNNSGRPNITAVLTHRRGDPSGKMDQVGFTPRVHPVRVRCHQCDRPVTPDLPEFPFEGFVLCLPCAEENAGRAEAGEGGLVEAEPRPAPYTADITGEPTFRVEAGELDELCERVEETLGAWADEARAGLPVLRDAYRSMTAGQRDEFALLVSAFLRTQGVAHERVANPYAAFHLGFRVNALDQAGSDSLYRGLYVGRGWEDLSHWLDVVATALPEWAAGREYAPTRAEVIRRLRVTPGLV